MRIHRLGRMHDRHAPASPMRDKIEEVGKRAYLLDPDLGARFALLLLSALVFLLARGLPRHRLGFHESHIRMISRQEPPAPVATSTGRSSGSRRFAQQELREALGQVQFSHPLGTVQEQRMGQPVKLPQEAIPCIGLKWEIHGGYSNSRYFSSSVLIFSRALAPSMRRILEGSPRASLA